MTKIETAIALARSSTGTLSRISVLIGPVGRNSKNIAAVRQSIAPVVEPTRNAANATGTASTAESVSTNEYAPG